ncbi:hypothetical protein [Crocosphaera sp.]|uniref:hypothetical protein n=1 Tax=Crocosphaera sp. TaxID=2729996 RepID=UPI00262EE051|nr:hypothetical protein [Crocosphaera sp.]MDJ0580053.1 hypothetical protein [Crocosphaera sp.]
MCEVDEQLKQLLEKAMGENPNSQTYKLLFQQIMFQMQQSGKILQRSHNVDIDSYQNAILKNWEWLRKKLPDYDPDIGRIYSWFNKTLYYRIKDEQSILFNQQNSEAYPLFDYQNGQWTNPLDLIPAPPKNYDLLQEIEVFLEKNRSKLESNYPQNCPQGNCYYLLNNRLPMGEIKPWNLLAEELESNPKTLNSHYQKKCLEFLRNWLEKQGYKL